MFIMCSARLPQGFFAKLLSAPGDAGECTSNGLYCFTGLPAQNAFEVFDANADDKWSALYGADTRYGGGKGVAGKLWSLPRDNGCTWRSGCAWVSEMLRTSSQLAVRLHYPPKRAGQEAPGERMPVCAVPLILFSATPHPLFPSAHLARVPTPSVSSFLPSPVCWCIRMYPPPCRHLGCFGRRLLHVQGWRQF
jgi:hypothetical protein